METKTSLKVYGIRNSYTYDGTFVSQSKLTKSLFAKNTNNSYVELKGYWHDPSLLATKENYFVVTKVNDQQIFGRDDLKKKLIQISKDNFNKTDANYGRNVVYFASESQLGYEYPLLSQEEEREISSDLYNEFDYKKILRYAFASSYVYHMSDYDNFPFKDNPMFIDLMIPKGSQQVQVIDKMDGGDHGVFAAAIKVPKVPDTDLEEEIIISYKGTSNMWDVLQDIELMIQNFFEANKDWQKESFDFFQRVAFKYPPKNSSIQSGYEYSNGQNSIVLTGHSLGGYTAIQTGMRAGVTTRAFSSPATKIIGKYTDVLSNTLYRNYAINFVRKNDPVVFASGRHEENMLYFSEVGINPLNNHYLTPFINDILIPNTQYYIPNFPENIYVTPNALLGAGLNKPINVWS